MYEERTYKVCFFKQTETNYFNFKIYKCLYYVIRNNDTFGEKFFRFVPMLAETL